MLRELHVRNLAVLAAASVELGEGLNALTGETGAGKSIVVDSLMLLAGSRASTDLIRSGAETLTVTGVFVPGGGAWRQLLEDAGLSLEEGEILIRREISREGRNRVFVNDQPTTLRLLADLAPYLLRIHGQREELGLVDPDLQRAWVDLRGGAAGERLTEATRRAYAAYQHLAGRLERLEGDERSRRERLELLRFQAQEIDEARPQEGEEDELRLERDALRNSEAITRSLGGAFELLFEEEGAAVDAVSRSADLLEEIADWEPLAREWAGELEDLRIRLQEVAQAVRSRFEGFEVDPGRLDFVESRLAVLERLCRKHGGSTAEVLAHRRRIDEELAELEGDADTREQLREQVDEALEAYRRAAVELSEGRQEWGEMLCRGMAEELADLGLGKALLRVRLERRGRQASPLEIDGEGVEMGPAGIDQVVFEFAPNPGEEPRPLGRIASGGELSRLYLALQLAVGEAREETSPTLVFDEVDAGVSGAQAAALGRKLQRLAERSQLLVVTHLPQVASHADHHFRVSKRVKAERTETAVDLLGNEARVEEVARLLAGSQVTDLSLSNAQELIRTAARGRG